MRSERAVWERFEKNVDRFGQKPALIDAVSGEELTYQDVADYARSYAEALKDRSEPAVAFVGEPALQELPLVLACAQLGLTFVPLSDKEPSVRLLDILRALPGSTLIASAEGLEGLERAQMTGALDQLNLSWQHKPSGRSAVPGPQPFLITHTSGSTGTPKAVAFSQVTKERRTQQSIDLFNVTADDRLLSPTPLHHSLGQRHLFLSLMTGATLVKTYPFNEVLWLQAVRDHKPSFAIPVATHLKLLQRHILADPDILASFRCLVTSSAPAEPEFKRAILDRSMFEFWEIYGMTETACATAVQYSKDGVTDHLGNAVNGSEVRLGSVSEDGSGEIEVLSDCLCDGYWGDPVRWRAALTADGYFRSGDLGRIDIQGRLHFLGRTNESFVSGGLLIHPAEIETAISEVAGIEDCLAFGQPDPVFGNIVAVAYTAADPVNKRDVMRHARSVLPKHMWPARVFALDTFPTLASGKLDRRGLMKQLETA